jgi:hypothetical protein
MPDRKVKRLTDNLAGSVKPQPLSGLKMKKAPPYKGGAFLISDHSSHFGSRQSNENYFCLDPPF